MTISFPLPAWYRSPMTQVVLVGITCFATIGMFSAVSNLGAGGLQDTALVDTANGVLYGMFALTGLISGGINNLLGPRLTLSIGSLGYSLYIGSLWCFQTQGTRWFVIFAGGVLGVSAALLWSAQGAIMMSYPLEKDKGKAFGVFWAIFQFGSFIGSVIALAINIRSGKLSDVSTATYLAFIIIMFIGTASTILILPPGDIIRADGTLVKVQASSSVREELSNFVKVLKDKRIIMLIPMFFASNYFYAYQGAVNVYYFDGATRALNGTLEGAGAMIGALIIGFFILDGLPFRRRTRGFVGLAFVSILTIVVWSCALAWQVDFNRTPRTKLHYTDSQYHAKGALYFFFYFGDACYQALAYWIMGAISNDPFTLARFTGFYKAIQSAGGAGSFGMDATSTPFLNELLASWCLMLVSLPLAGIVIWGIKDTSYTEEKTVYVSDVATQSGAAESTENDNMSDVKEKV
ncbi:MFS general substrate transporter [Lactarius akahatsu]|uniref:MFS general substrate transporter n=1 Tax=Lactarius akahatsu TaxID=416441 RepID=A0AAD4LMR1_9AGAM|nr:MFS general substrate transporter [Lactarius akahatsu]